MGHILPVCLRAQCEFLSPYHVLHRHGLRGHGRGAPLCGRHGLILPVLAPGQLLLSGLAPMHIWPGEGRAEQQHKHTIRLFLFFLAQPEANFSNTKNHVFLFTFFYVLNPVRRIMNLFKDKYCKYGRNTSESVYCSLLPLTLSSSKQ